jgi:hypothetical protein
VACSTLCTCAHHYGTYNATRPDQTAVSTARAAALAQYFNTDATLIWVLFVVLALLGVLAS